MTGENNATCNDDFEDEYQIITEIVNGNTELFAKIIDNYQKKIIILIRRFIYNDDEVDDVLQEIFIKVYNNLSKFKFKSSIGTWIYRITVNHCLEHKRKHKRRKKIRLVRDEAAFIDNINVDEVTPEVILKRKLIREEMLNILDNKLSGQQKSVFVLKYFENLQLKEIAEIMDLSEGTVKTHLSRAYSKIREDLKGLFNE